MKNVCLEYVVQENLAELRRDSGDGERKGERSRVSGAGA